MVFLVDSSYVMLLLVFPGLGDGYRCRGREGEGPYAPDCANLAGREDQQAGQDPHPTAPDHHQER